MTHIGVAARVASRERTPGAGLTRPLVQGNRLRSIWSIRGHGGGTGLKAEGISNEKRSELHGGKEKMEDGEESV